MGDTATRQMIGSGGTLSRQRANGAPSTDPVSRWRMWVLSLIGLYPLVLGFLAFVAPHVVRWPLPAKAALYPFVLLTLMTYVIMPALTRLMRRWL